MKRVYLDNAATTQPGFLNSMHAERLSYIVYGNPSSVMYEEGYEANKLLKKARNSIEQLLGVEDTGHVYFTSGGTESDNWAIKGFAWANRDKGNHIITSNIEHYAVLRSCEFLEKCGFEVTYLDVDSNGVVDPQDVANAITDNTILVSIMMANNEIGTIEPIEDIIKVSHERGVAVHTDAVQAIRNIPINISKMGVDMLSFSGHKFHGSKGVGGLYIRDDIKIEPLLHGGHQENGMRASTVNMPSIVEMAEVLKHVTENRLSYQETMQQLSEKLWHGISEACPEAKLIGQDLNIRLCNNLNIMFPEVEAETLVLLLDHEGVSASTGSACNTGSLEPSHVLKAIGLSDKEANSCVRFSLDSSIKQEDIEYAVEAIKKALAEYNKL